MNHTNNPSTSDTMDRLGSNLNNDSFKGMWSQMKGEVKRRWGQLTDDEMMEAEGNFDKLVGIIQQRYGQSRQQVEQELRQMMSQGQSSRN